VSAQRSKPGDLLDPGDRRAVELGFMRERTGQGPRGGAARTAVVGTAVVEVTGEQGPATVGRRLPRRIAGTLILIGVTTAWFGLLAPRFMGGPASYVMVSGTSMEPSLSTGDLVVARRQAEYRVGDVVAYRVPEGEVGEGQVVIHRIIGGSAGLGYVLQGDNRDTPDLWRPHPDDIDGKLWFVIPGAGRWALFLRAPFVLALIAGLIAFSVALGGKDDTARAEADARDAEPR